KVTLRSRISSRLIERPGYSLSPPKGGEGSLRRAQMCSSGDPARVEGVAHGLADEDEEAQHDREHDKGGDAEPWRLQIGLALRQQLAERGRARRQAEAEKIERGQSGDRAVQDERHKGQGRDRRIRQYVTPDDNRIGNAERTCGADIIEVARAQ